MKVLTLWQPHCSLCVIINPETGLPWKTIETRSWKPPKSLIGRRIALHAAATRSRALTCDLGPWRYGGLSNCLWREDSDHKVRDYQHVPLGAIVATCTLKDVVPMVAECSNANQHLVVSDSNLLLHAAWSQRSVEDQRPYGLFEPGRYAWLLADVEPIDPPVPFKGGQGLTRTWTP